MDIQTEKIALVKRLLDTDDEAILIQVKEVLRTAKKISGTTYQLMWKKASSAQNNKQQPDNLRLIMRLWRNTPSIYEISRYLDRLSLGNIRPYHKPNWN